MKILHLPLQKLDASRDEAFAGAGYWPAFIAPQFCVLLGHLLGRSTAFNKERPFAPL